MRVGFCDKWKRAFNEERNFSFLDNQKRAFTFEDQNSFVSLNVSSMKELKFKFKLSKNTAENKTIASIRIPTEKDLKVGNIVALLACNIDCTVYCNSCPNVIV